MMKLKVIEEPSKMQFGGRQSLSTARVKREAGTGRLAKQQRLPMTWSAAEQSISLGATVMTKRAVGQPETALATNGVNLAPRTGDEQDQDYSLQTNKYQQKRQLRHKQILKHKQEQGAKLPPLTKLVIRCLLIVTILSGVGCVVVYQVRPIATKSGRTDYVLAGESLELSCHYMMKDEAEDIKQLIWSKDGKNFLRWRKNRPGLEVLSYTFKGHVDPTSVHSHLIIHNATIDMHGKYKCSIRTDLGTHESEHDLIIISHGQCKLNDWRITSERSKCRELFRLDCRQMFPRPVPSCGLWNDKLDKFIRSVTVDISEEAPPSSLPPINQHQLTTTTSKAAQFGTTMVAPPPHTYRVKYSDKFELTLANGSANPLYADLLPYAGHLIFKCDILVPDTSWKLSLRHKMFDFADGCNSDPLETIERLRLEFSQLARMRLHKHHQQQRPLDDIEMLTTNLKYEILPPPLVTKSSQANRSHSSDVEASYQMLSTSDDAIKSNLSRMSDKSKNLNNNNNNKSQHDNLVATASRNLNCWQKPRIGSLARLSCVPPIATTTTSQKNQYKLSGTNLLECRPNGQWVPISARPVSSSIVVANEVIGLKRTTKVQSKKTNSRPTRRLQATLSEHSSGNQSGLGPNQAHSDSPVDERNSLTYRNGNDDDDSDSDDSAPTLSSHGNGSDSNRTNRSASTSPIEFEVGAIIPEQTIVSTSGNGSGGDDYNASNNDKSEHDDKHHFDIDSNQIVAELTPGELASLLPSCVLINANQQHHQNGRRIGNQRHHLASSTNLDRLPLALDDEAALLLESNYPTTSGNSRHFKSAHGHQKGTNNDNDSRWYTFFSSSSSSSGTSSSKFKLNQRSHYIGLIIVLFTTTAMLTHVTRILRLQY